MSKTALIIIAEGSEEIEAITPGDVLCRAGIDVTYAGVSTTTPRGAHGLPLRASCLTEDLGGVLFDLVVIPGGSRGADHIHKSPCADAILRHHLDEGRFVAAICAAPAVVLAPLGALKGKHAVCYPGLEHRLGEGVTLGIGNVVVDGNIITSRGPGTAIEFSLRLVDLLLDPDASDRVGRAMLVAGV